jgi:hypothetical protein
LYEQKCFPVRLEFVMKTEISVLVLTRTRRFFLPWHKGGLVLMTRPCPLKHKRDLHVYIYCSSQLPILHRRILFHHQNHHAINIISYQPTQNCCGRLRLPEKAEPQAVNVPRQCQDNTTALTLSCLLRTGPPACSWPSLIFTANPGRQICLCVPESFPLPNFPSARQL